MALEAGDRWAGSLARSRGGRDPFTRALLDLSHHLTRAESVDAVARLVADAVPGFVEAEAAAVLVWHADVERLRVAATTGLPEHMARAATGFEVGPDDLPDLGRALDDLRPRVMTLADADPFPALVMESFDVEAAVVAPVVSGGRFLGYLSAVLPAGTRQPVSGVDAEALGGLADLAATALDVAMTREERRRRSDTTEVLLDLAGALAALHDVPGIAEAVARAIPRMVRADASAVLLVDRTRHVLSVAGLWGWPEELADAVAGFEVPLDASPLVRTAVESPEPIYVTADAEDAVIAAVLAEFETDAALVVPVVARGEPLGVVAAVARGPAPRTPDAVTVERLQGLADQAATALDGARLVAALRDARATLAHIIDAGPIVTFRGTTDGFRITYVSANVHRIAGYDPEEFLRRNWLDLVHPDDLETASREIARVVDDGEASFEVRFRVADGGYRWIEIRLRADETGADGHRQILGYVWDQTERRLAEERYRAVSELTSDVAYCWAVHEDGGGELEWTAGSLERLTGYSADEVLALHGWPGMLVDEDRESYRRRVARLVEGREVTDDFRVRVRSGEVRWLRVYARPELDERGGRVRRIYGAVQDVTAQRRAQELHRAVSETISDAAFSSSVVDGRLVTDWVVGGWERISGHRLPDPPPPDLFTPIAHPDDLAVVRGVDAEVLAGQPSVAEFRILTPEREARWLRVYASPVVDKVSGAVVSVHGAAQDVTQRRRAEEALRASEARLRAVVEASPLAIMAFDAHARVTLWNPAAERMFGYSAAEIYGRPLPVVPDDRRDEHRMLLDRIGAGEPIELFETQRCRKDGSLVDVVISAARLGAAGHGVEAGAVAVMLDVSERKELERQVQQAETLSAIGRLAGGVAHDFNNLLTAILGHAEFLLDEADDPEAVRENAEATQRAAEQAAGLTEQLLTLGRRQVPNAVLLDAHEVVAATARTLHGLAGDGVDFRVRLAAEPAWVRMSRSQLEQVVLNLGMNARDALAGAGTVTVESEVDHDAGLFTLRVSDTGSGMDDETCRHVFDPFFTTKEGGTGLGLAVVYGIVESLRGAVAVTSAPGRGSTFEVRLPLAAPPGSGEAPAAPGREGRVVLVVDDDERVRALTRRALERSGATVVEAADADEAVARFDERGGAVDLLVTDVVMPGGEGPELADRLRRRRPGLAVLYVSGYTDRLAEVAASADRGTVFLAKPFRPSQLRDAVEGVLAPSSA